MNTFELGKFWLRRLDEVLPQSSIRVRTRLAWHLARLDVRSEEQLEQLSDAALAGAPGKAERLVDIRRQYLRCQKLVAQGDVGRADMARNNRFVNEAIAAQAPRKRSIDPRKPMPVGFR